MGGRRRNSRKGKRTGRRSYPQDDDEKVTINCPIFIVFLCTHLCSQLRERVRRIETNNEGTEKILSWSIPHLHWTPTFWHLACDGWMDGEEVGLS